MNGTLDRTKANYCTSLFFAVLALGFSGCATTQNARAPELPPHVGKYYNEHNMQRFTLLKPDGTFLVHEGNGDQTGKYQVKGDTLLLTPEGKAVSLLGRIYGCTLCDNNGEKWFRPPINFTNRTVLCKDGLPGRPYRLPKDWFLRAWDGRYYVGVFPKGPPPSYLNAEAAIVVLPHGEADKLANADNMIADTPTHSIHLSLAPSGRLWPSAVKDILDMFLAEEAPGQR